MSKPTDKSACVSRDCAVYTLAGIAFGTDAALVVAHSEDDHRWVLLGATPADVDTVVSWGSLVDRDATLGELADLPPGWTAQRSGPGESWVRQPSRNCPSASGDAHDLLRCA